MYRSLRGGKDWAGGYFPSKVFVRPSMDLSIVFFFLQILLFLVVSFCTTDGYTGWMSITADNKRVRLSLIFSFLFSFTRGEVGCRPGERRDGCLTLLTRSNCWWIWQHFNCTVNEQAHSCLSFFFILSPRRQRNSLNHFHSTH